MNNFVSGITFYLKGHNISLDTSRVPCPLKSSRSIRGLTHLSSDVQESVIQLFLLGNGEM